MTGSLFSDSWYRVAELKPRLRQHVEIQRRHFRGKRWYVLQDHVTGKFHRFSPDAYFVIQLMDGSRTVNEIWMMASQKLDSEHLPTQDDVIQLLSRLHNADVILGGVRPDSDELVQRQQTLRKKKIYSYFINPLGLRFPLLNPEPWLQQMPSLPGILFSLTTACVWLLLVGSALVMALRNWDVLSLNVADHVLSAENMVLLWMVYPVVKFLHEMGHALAVKRWGGEVHEMGIMLMVLVPIPYVDASDAHAFRKKYQRIMVSSAGVAVELFLAALAMWFWVYAEEGVGRAIAYNVMLIAGVSTVLFNFNPLLRFDGYHVLADWLEIPNLGQRSNQYLGYLIKQYIFRAKDIRSPANAAGERFWFVFYSIASFCYRMFILYVIVLFVAGRYFVIGVILAIWAGIMMLIVPAFKVIKATWTDPRLEEHMGQGMSICVGMLLAVLLMLALIPVSSSTLAEGVVWVPEQMWVRAGSDGFVSRVIAKENSIVHSGDILIQCEAPELHAKRKVIIARLAELRVRYTAAIKEDRVQARLLQEEIDQAEAEYFYLSDRIEALTIRSPGKGLFQIKEPENLIGRFVRRGEMLAYVVRPDEVHIRAVVMQEDIKQVRKKTVQVQVRLSEQFANVFNTSLLREVPAAIHILPSMAFAVEGGGNIALDPQSRDKLQAFKSLFQFDIALPRHYKASMMGSRVYVRFVYADEALLWQWYRQMRQTFLSVLHI